MKNTKIMHTTTNNKYWMTVKCDQTHSYTCNNSNKYSTRKYANSKVGKDTEEMDTEKTTKDTKAAKGMMAKEAATTDTKAKAADTMNIEVKARVIKDTNNPTITQAPAK